MGAWIDGDGRCTSCGDWARDCVCDMCETCSALAPAGSMETCETCACLVCETCETCGACAPVCERCGEGSRDLASARPSDWNAPEWCGACRGAMFAARDVADALAADGIPSAWIDTGDGYALAVGAADCVVTVAESEYMDASEYGERCAVMGVTLSDALGPFDAVAWCDPSSRPSTGSATVWAESVADVVAAVARARAHAGIRP